MHPAAVSNYKPWQIAAIGFLSLAKLYTKAITDLSSLKYSGALPPGITSPI